jgi:hypothetical protein
VADRAILNLDGDGIPLFQADRGRVVGPAAAFAKDGARMLPVADPLRARRSDSYRDVECARHSSSRHLG